VNEAYKAHTGKDKEVLGFTSRSKKVIYSIDSAVVLLHEFEHMNGSNEEPGHWHYGNN
jgi:hypothetical protein